MVNKKRFFNLYQVYHVIVQQSYLFSTVPVRLVDGDSPAEGRVELFYNGAWGTVCNEGWDLRDGHVICRMLGYNHALEATDGRRYRNFKSYIWLSAVKCSGIESNILACRHGGWGTRQCSQSGQAGVVCFTPDPTGGFKCVWNWIIAVGRISDCQPGRPGLNPPAWSRAERCASSFATPSMDRDVKLLV